MEVTQYLWDRANFFPLKLQTLKNTTTNNNKKLGSAENLFSDPHPTSFHTHYSLLVPTPLSFLTAPSILKPCPFPSHSSTPNPLPLVQHRDF